MASPSSSETAFISVSATRLCLYEIYPLLINKNYESKLDFLGADMLDDEKVGVGLFQVV